jgi:hypothetical protein
VTVHPSVHPYPAQRIYVYEYGPVYPRESAVHHEASRRAYMEDAGRRWDAMTHHGRDLSPYEADRYFGHPRYPANVHAWDGRFDPWRNWSISSSRDSNPSDYATGIYNPKR